jgi:hypothetical protein
LQAWLFTSMHYGGVMAEACEGVHGEFGLHDWRRLSLRRA